jgi:hypothetical protein
LIPSTTPAGSALHQCSVADVKTASNVPFNLGSRTEGRFWISASIRSTPGRVVFAFSSYRYQLMSLL